MTKLTDTQRVVLSAASQRTDRLALPLPSDEGHGLTLIITDAGFAAIGIESEPQNPKAQKPRPSPPPQNIRPERAPSSP